MSLPVAHTATESRALFDSMCYNPTEWPHVFAMFLRNWPTVNRKIDKVVSDDKIFTKIANELVVQAPGEHS